MSEFQNVPFTGTPLAIPLSASFRELFVHRNAATAWFNAAATVLTEEEDDRVLSIISGCENEILARPATSADDTVIKLLSLAQIAAEGHEPNDEIATQVILEAQRTLGLGYVYQEEPAPQTFQAVFGKYLVATRRFQALPADLELTDETLFEREESRFLDAVRMLAGAQPTTGHEFVQWFRALHDDGASSLRSEVHQHMMAVAKALTNDNPSAANGADCAAWDEAWTVYSKALAAENAYDAVHIDPFLRRDLPVGPERTAAARQVSPEAWEESSRLGDARGNAEDTLFGMPSPDLAAFARKVIICRADERDLNGLDGHLVAEARRLLGEGA